MSVTQAEVRQLKEGRYMVIDDEPCKILSIAHSKPGKHGAAKARIDAVGLFDERTRSVVHTVSDKVKVPMIDKRKAQIIALAGPSVQLMDLETYEQFELPITEELQGELTPGGEVMYMEVMGRRKITKVDAVEE
ncbi:MAG TPA: translation initiation factor IF-5A [Candidatus Thermoplasmatota archaeon]|nr:translation initiation factor IF-5A [Candidatus Thermoplasmatota archaeon]